MKLLIAFGFSLLILAATPAIAQQSPQQTFRDAIDRTIGTATHSGNQTTFRNERSQTTGTATTDSSGVTTFRDENVATARSSRRCWSVHKNYS